MKILLIKGFATSACNPEALEAACQMRTYFFSVTGRFYSARFGHFGKAYDRILHLSRLRAGTNYSLALVADNLGLITPNDAVPKKNQRL
jgi:hypothetical protein